MKKTKKIIALFLAVLMTFAFFSFSTQAADTEEISPRSITIASSVFRNFYSNSGGSTITLSRGCDFVSFQIDCASGTDDIMAVITDHTHNGAYNTVLAIRGDGSTTTVETYFAAGSYTITLYGSNKLHTLGLVAFST